MKKCRHCGEKMKFYGPPINDYACKNTECNLKLQNPENFNSKMYRDIGRFSAFQWAAHYLGITRIVWDPKKNAWRIFPNGYNPLLYVFIFFVGILTPLFSKDTLQGNYQDLKSVLTGEDEDLWRLYNPRFISYRNAPSQ